MAKAKTPEQKAADAIAKAEKKLMAKKASQKVKPTEEVTTEAPVLPPSEEIEGTVALVTDSDEIAQEGSEEQTAEPDQEDPAKEPEVEVSELPSTKIYSTYGNTLQEILDRIVRVWKLGYDFPKGVLPRIASGSLRTAKFEVPTDFDQMLLSKPLIPEKGTYYKITLNHINSGQIIKELKAIVDGGGYLDTTQRSTSSGQYIVHALSTKDIPNRTGLRNHGAIEIK